MPLPKDTSGDGESASGARVSYFMVLLRSIFPQVHLMISATMNRTRCVTSSALCKCNRVSRARTPIQSTSLVDGRHSQGVLHRRFLSHQFTPASELCIAKRRNSDLLRSCQLLEKTKRVLRAIVSIAYNKIWHISEPLAVTQEWSEPCAYGWIKLDRWGDGTDQID